MFLRNEKFTRLPALSPIRFFYRKPAEWIDPNGKAGSERAIYRFSHGRTALRAGLDALGLQKGDRVLIPDFNCDVVAGPLREIGVEAVYYTISRDLSPDWDELAALSDTSTKALFVVHYFGQPQDVEKIQSFCKVHNQFLIEDNCHGLGALASNGQDLGSFGDISIASPRKSLPILNGGLLETPRSREITMDAPLQSEPFNPMRHLIGFTARSILSFFPFILNRFRSPQPYHIQGAFSEDDPSGWSMDWESAKIWQSTDVRKLAQDRRQIYKIWENFISDTELEPVFKKCAPGASPLIFAARAPTEEIRNRWFSWGFEHRIDVHSWPTLPKELVKEKGPACELWQHLVCFPIHQEMNQKRLTKKLSKINPPV